MTNYSRPHYHVGGTVPTESPSYVVREADNDLYQSLLAGEYCHVLDCRQVGKSSLMVRTAKQLRSAGIICVVLDLTSIGSKLTNYQWYFGLLYSVASQMDCVEIVEEFWEKHESLGPAQRWVACLREVILGSVAGANPLVLFLDEVDTVKSLDFPSDEFFAGIRECYNRRTEDATFQRLTFCLLGVAAPIMLTKNPLTTPFNIGKQITLTDFTEEEAIPLAEGLMRAKTGSRGSVLDSKRLLRRVLFWTGGQPYLTQSLCKAIAEEMNTTSPIPNMKMVDKVCGSLFLSGSARETETNLVQVARSILGLNSNVANVLYLYERTLKQPVRIDPADPYMEVLQLSGVVHIGFGFAKVRNRIYRQVFDRRWIRENMPDAYLRRERRTLIRAYTRSAIFSFSVIAVLILSGAYNTLSRRMAERNNKLRLLSSEISGVQSELYLSRQKLKDSAAKSKQLDTEVKSAQSLLSASVAQTTKLEIRAAKAETNFTRLEADAKQLKESNENLSKRVEIRALAAEPSRMLTALRTASSSVRAELRRYPKADDDLVGQLVSAYQANAYPVKRWSLSGKITTARYSPDERKILTVGSDHIIRVWDIVSRALLFTSRKEDGEFIDAWFDGGGFALVGMGKEKVRVWKWESRLPIDAPVINGTVLGARYHAAGYVVVVYRANDQTIRVKSTAWGGQSFIPDPTGLITHASFSPNGEWFVTGDVKGNVKAWHTIHDDVGNHPKDGMARSLNRDVSVGSAIVDISVHGDRFEAVGSDGHVVDWRQNIGPWLHQYPGLKDARKAFLTTGGQTRAVIWANGTASLYPSHYDAGEIVSIEPIDGVTGLDVSKDSDRFLVVTRSGKLEEWASPFPRLVGQFGRLNYAEFSHDGSRIITASGKSDYGSAYLWKYTGGLRTVQLGAVNNKGNIDEVFHATFSPDGKRAITGGRFKQLALVRWNLTENVKLVDGNPVQLEGWIPLRGHNEGDDVNFIAYSKNGDRFVTTSTDKTIRIWNSATEQCEQILNGHQKSVRTAFFSPDDKSLLTAGADGKILIWNSPFTQPREVRRFGNTVWCASWNPAQSTFVAAIAAEPTRIMDLNGKELMRLPQPKGVFSTWARFSPKGDRIATADSDQRVRIWDAKTGRLILTWGGHTAKIWTVQFAPDGKYVVTASEDSTARIYPATVEELLRSTELFLKSEKLNYQ